MKQPWWKDGIRFQCQGSGKCCVSRGEYGSVYLTLEDRRRLARHFNLSTKEFTKTYCQNSDGFWELKNQRNDCVFLKGSGCSVYESRPTQCRTWPFWPENMSPKAWKKEVQEFCPGVGKGRLWSAEEIREQIKIQSQSEAKL